MPPEGEGPSFPLIAFRLTDGSPRPRSFIFAPSWLLAMSEVSSLPLYFSFDFDLLTCRATFFFGFCSVPLRKISPPAFRLSLCCVSFLGVLFLHRASLVSSGFHFPVVFFPSSPWLLLLTFAREGRSEVPFFFVFLFSLDVGELVLILSFFLSPSRSSPLSG